MEYLVEQLYAEVGVLVVEEWRKVDGYGGEEQKLAACAVGAAHP